VMPNTHIGVGEQQVRFLYKRLLRALTKTLIWKMVMLLPQSPRSE
jgi:hypothetical protein